LSDMNTWSRLAPFAFEQLLGRFAVPILRVLVGMALAIMTLWAIQANGAWALVIGGMSILLWAATLHRGLAAVPRPVFWIAVFLLIGFPAFFLAKFRHANNMAGVQWFGFAVMVLVVSGLILLLKQEDRRVRQRSGQGPLKDDPCAMVRLALMRLWAITMGLVVIGAYLPATVCMAALVWRGPLTAKLAAGLTVLAAVLGYEDRLVWTTDWVTWLLALAAGLEWWKASNLGLWDRHSYRDAMK
jgi:hypothetical protein